MYCTYRRGTPQDWDSCIEIMHDSFLYDSTQARKDLKDFWNSLDPLTCPVAVILSNDSPCPRKIASFGLALFLTDEFVREAKTTLPPYLGPQIISRWKNGKPVHLGPGKIAEKNAAGGLNLFTLTHGYLATCQKLLYKDELLQKSAEAFFWYHGGYQAKEFLQETMGELEGQTWPKLGFTLYRDYQEVPGLKGLKNEKTPRLFGITPREMAEANVNDLRLHQFFDYHPPRFEFSKSERDVLSQALEGLPEKEVAELLGLSIWTIKKRWQGIYGKVLRLDSTFLGLQKPDREEVPDGDPSGRRRLLLAYLRHHLEEIRPYEKPSEMDRSADKTNEIEA